MTVDAALVRVKITLLLLCLWVLLFFSGWPQIECSPYHSPPEVVIPMRVTGTPRGMMSDQISFNLHFGGQRHTIHMKVKKLLVSRHFSVFTYTDQGAVIEDQPFVQNDCYYHGYVEGDPESMVALSTCLGNFQGMIMLNETVYEIKPKRFSATFEHLVSKMDSEDTQPPIRRCGLTEEEIAHQLKFLENDNFTLMQSGYEGWWTHRWTVELAVVVDHTRYLHWQSNVSSVEKEVFAISHLVNVYYAPMDVEVSLSAVEIWNTGNPLDIDDIFDLLNEFCLWKRISFYARVPHDVIHLFVKRDYGIYLGLATVGAVCIQSHNCAVDSILSDSYPRLSQIVAHELGHNLGMSHDVPKICTCGRRTCLMFPYATSSTRFSNCSYSYMFDTVLRRSCVRNTPNPLVNIFPEKRCGNGVVEEGEECDCGSLKSCTDDPCCLENCYMKHGAACASGLCCKKCQFLPSGTMCREQANECDLPEWCNGTSHECPEDVYVEDGSPCPEKGFCYKKECHDRDKQCKNIFGMEAKSANQICYLAMNTRGDRFGHCGIRDDSYTRCNMSNILCGRVQCENVAEIPSLKDHTTIHRTPINGIDCWGTDHHWGMTIPDVGEVKDGTECGLGHVCMKRKCVSTSAFGQNCVSDTCNMKGICNNKHHCHCKDGWAPPDCLKDGDGGSVDSGPPPKKKQVSQTLVFFLLGTLLPLLCIFFLVLSKNRRKRKRNIQTPQMKESQSILNSSIGTEQHTHYPLMKENSRKYSSTKVKQSIRRSSTKVKPHSQTSLVREEPHTSTSERRFSSKKK